MEIEYLEMTTNSSKNSEFTTTVLLFVWLALQLSLFQ